MLRLGATCSSPQCPKSSSSVCMGGGHGQCGLPASVVRALHMTTATEHNLPNAQHSQHIFEAGGLIPPSSFSLTSRDRRSTLIHHAHCRAENRIYLLTPGERHPATVLSGTTSALGLARGFFPRCLFGDRESNDAPCPDLKIFSAQDHGRRLQDEDDVPHFTPGAADPTQGLLPPACNYTPANDSRAHARLVSAELYASPTAAAATPRVQNDGSVLSAHMGRASPTRPMRGCSSTPLPSSAHLRQPPTYLVCLLWCLCLRSGFSDGQVKGNSIGHTSSNRDALSPQGQHATSWVKDTVRTVRWLIPPHDRQQLS